MNSIATTSGGKRARTRANDRSDDLAIAPQDLEAERCVLGCMLFSSSARDGIRTHVTAKSFYMEAHRKLFAAIAAMHDTGRIEIDAVTLRDELQRRGELDQVGGVAYLTRIMETVPHAEHAEMYAKIVRDKFDRRRTADSGRELVRCANDPTKSIDGIKATASIVLKSLDETLGSTRTYSCTDLNDIGNAAHFAATFGDRLRHCHSWNKWLVWDGCRWKLDDEDRPLKLAMELVNQMFRDAMVNRGQDVLKHVTESAKLARLRAMIELAGPGLTIRTDELDHDSWSLNCLNGIVNLRTGVLQPHDREKRLTKLCPTEFDANAACPVWLRFLSDVFGGAEDMIQFVERLFGYCLTGDVSEQKMALFYGSGANGKSTLLNAFMSTVGSDYSMQCMPDFLMEKRSEGHPTEKASLFGKRFVSCVETEASRKLAESAVKMLTGGERIMARRMREDFWEFDPTHKLVLCTNHKPIIKGTDHGIWRRLLLVPFEKRFDGARQNKNLAEQLKGERAGILAWAVRGCLAWQRVGLNPPATVCEATANYRSAEDIFGRFVTDCCVSNPSESVRFSALYDRFEQWAEDAGEFLPSKRAIGVWLDDNGFEKFSANGRLYRGIALKGDKELESTAHGMNGTIGTKFPHDF